MIFIKNTILITTIVALFIGGVSFFIDTKYQQGKQSNVRRIFTGQGQDLQTGQFGQAQRVNGIANRLGFQPVNNLCQRIDFKWSSSKVSPWVSKERP